VTKEYLFLGRNLYFQHTQAFKLTMLEVSLTSLTETVFCSRGMLPN